MSEKEELISELKVLDKKAKTLQEHIEKLDIQISELGTVASAAEDFSALKADDEIQVPIANGVYFKAKIADTSKMLVNVGSGICVEKDIPAVKKLVLEQIEEITKYRMKAVGKFQEVIARVEQIQTKFKGG